MLHVKFLPQGVREVPHLPRLTLPHPHLLQPVILDHYCQLAISVTQHGAVIDIGGSNEGDAVINDEEFAVNVYDFGEGAIGQFGVGPQTEEEEVVIQIGHFP